MTGIVVAAPDPSHHTRTPLRETASTIGPRCSQRSLSVTFPATMDGLMSGWTQAGADADAASTSAGPPQADPTSDIVVVVDLSSYDQLPLFLSRLPAVQQQQIQLGQEPSALEHLRGSLTSLIVRDEREVFLFRALLSRCGFFALDWQSFLLNPHVGGPTVLVVSLTETYWPTPSRDFVARFSTFAVFLDAEVLALCGGLFFLQRELARSQKQRKKAEAEEKARLGLTMSPGGGEDETGEAVEEPRSQTVYLLQTLGSRSVQAAGDGGRSIADLPEFGYIFPAPTSSLSSSAASAANSLHIAEMSMQSCVGVRLVLAEHSRRKEHRSVADEMAVLGDGDREELEGARKECFLGRLELMEGPGFDPTATATAGASSSAGPFGNMFRTGAELVSVFCELCRVAPLGAFGTHLMDFSAECMLSYFAEAAAVHAEQCMAAEALLMASRHYRLSGLLSPQATRAYFEEARKQFTSRYATPLLHSRPASLQLFRTISRLLLIFQHFLAQVEESREAVALFWMRDALKLPPNISRDARIVLLVYDEELAAGLSQRLPHAGSETAATRAEVFAIRDPFGPLPPGLFGGCGCERQGGDDEGNGNRGEAAAAAAAVPTSLFICVVAPTITDDFLSFQLSHCQERFLRRRRRGNSNGNGNSNGHRDWSTPSPITLLVLVDTLVRRSEQSALGMKERHRAALKESVAKAADARRKLREAHGLEGTMKRNQQTEAILRMVVEPGTLPPAAAPFGMAATVGPSLAGIVSAGSAYVAGSTGAATVAGTGGVDTSGPGLLLDTGAAASSLRGPAMTADGSDAVGWGVHAAVLDGRMMPMYGGIPPHSSSIGVLSAAVGGGEGHMLPAVEFNDRLMSSEAYLMGNRHIWLQRMQQWFRNWRPDYVDSFSRMSNPKQFLVQMCSIWKVGTKPVEFCDTRAAGPSHQVRFDMRGVLFFAMDQSKMRTEKYETAVLQSPSKKAGEFVLCKLILDLIFECV